MFSKKTTGFLMVMGLVLFLSACVGGAGEVNNILSGGEDNSILSAGGVSDLAGTSDSEYSQTEQSGENNSGTDETTGDVLTSEQESSGEETSGISSGDTSLDVTGPSGEESVLSAEEPSQEKSEESSLQQGAAEELAEEPESKPPLGGSNESSEETVWIGPIFIDMPSTGSLSISKNNCTIDYSNAAEGYVMIKCDDKDNKYLINIKSPEKKTDAYYVVNNGEYEVFPLKHGSSEYTVIVAKEIIRPSSGLSQYATVLSYEFTVDIANEYSSYLYPNYYVDYDQNSLAVKKSLDLCVIAKTDLEKIEIIYNYIIKNFEYDHVFAELVRSKEYTGGRRITDMDVFMRDKLGVCMDYASLMACMLRVQGIPTKLVLGETEFNGNDDKHAWNMVYTKEKGWVALKIEFNGKSYRLMDSNVAHLYSTAEVETLLKNNKYTALEEY